MVVVDPWPRPVAPVAVVAQEVLVNVAPKKANWDLKRDLQPKLDRLERRTQVGPSRGAQAGATGRGWCWAG